MTYANIIVDISHEKLDKPFQYRIPEELEGKAHFLEWWSRFPLAGATASSRAM